MNDKFSEDLYLTNETSRHLFHTYAKNLPIIDYHCHLLPQEIYENKVFEDLGEMWLAHDHYKWRIMRTFGIEEKYITGCASYHDKFLAFAGIMPFLLGNPIYIWCSLELKRYFNIEVPLCAENSEAIYQQTKAFIQQTGMCPRTCMEQSNVKAVCTTDDPIDTLEYHNKIKHDQNFSIQVLATFRPDKALYCEKEDFPHYLKALEKASGTAITSFATLMDALEQRLCYFVSLGYRISDCSLEAFCWCEASAEELDGILSRARTGNVLTQKDINQYRTAFVRELAEKYENYHVVMQLHLGAYRNVNSRMALALGADTGYDCIDDTTYLHSISQLLDVLNTRHCLPRTILYPLNSNELEGYAVLAAAFCKGPNRALVQLGAPWWFHDQVYGIRRQFEAISNLYPLSLSIGMITDSRSFLSYPRHELYRRLLCEYLGKLIESGEYFSGDKAIQTMIQCVCYENAAHYLNLDL